MQCSKFSKGLRWSGIINCVSLHTSQSFFLQCMPVSDAVLWFFPPPGVVILVGFCCSLNDCFLILFFFFRGSVSMHSWLLHFTYPSNCSAHGGHVCLKQLMQCCVVALHLQFGSSLWFTLREHVLSFHSVGQPRFSLILSSVKSTKNVYIAV